jgi:hypothetical protein
MWHPLSAKVGNHFADKLRSLGRYSSLADSTPWSFSFLYLNKTAVNSSTKTGECFHTIICLASKLSYHVYTEPKLISVGAFIPEPEVRMHSHVDKLWCMQTATPLYTKYCITAEQFHRVCRLPTHTTWLVLRLRMYWIMSCGRPTRGSPPVFCSA